MVPGPQHLFPQKLLMAPLSMPTPGEPPKERRWHLQEGAYRNWSCIFCFAPLIGYRREGDSEFGRDGMAGIGNRGVAANRLPTLEIPLGVLV